LVNCGAESFIITGLLLYPGMVESMIRKAA
jgi:hypothetical protein